MCLLLKFECTDQVGGSMAALEAHIGAVKGHKLLGHDIDFKLARSPGPRSSQAAEETGFTSLSVSLCKVLLLCSFLCVSCLCGQHPASSILAAFPLFTERQACACRKLCHWELLSL